ncbi:CASP-like protein 4D1 [Lycium ferocissimum]|uniref:CASP-like protein 4D1 n=1 Tax=Lycium ferocissimum TaxID=112874 RepID=UPI00281654C2|nr:CASP-like protein 4D1 [Lycium ferocissimum]
MAKSKLTIISIAVLRILTLLTCKAAIVLTILANNFTLQDGQQINFSNIRGYWYVLAAAGVGVLYSMYQLPFALYHAVKGKRLIKGQLLPILDFYGDKVIAFILASGVGVGFGVSIELKNLTDESIENSADESIDRKLAIELFKEFRDNMDKFYNGGIIASGILLAGFTTMAILTILSSAKRTGRSF